MSPVTDRHMGGSWLRRLAEPRPGERVGSLVCFPHAGAGAGAYAEWPRRLTTDFDLWAVRPPGRGERMREPAATSLGHMVDAVTSAIERLDPPRLALFGHSMGALTAFETARALRRRNRWTDLLVLSAPAWPVTERPAAAPRRRTDSELLALCADLGADEVELFAQDAELRSLVLEPLRQDLLGLERHVVEPAAPLGTPTVLLMGEDDASAGRDLVDAWSSHLMRIAGERTYAGGHFFVRSAVAAVLEDLDRDLDAVAQQRLGATEESW